MATPKNESTTDEHQETERETYTCDKEKKRFGSWSWRAGSLKEPQLLKKIPTARIAIVEAGDRRILRGLHLHSNAAVQVALLVIPGNAWSTKAFSSISKLFPTDDLDVFMFDFRGYGLSKPGHTSMSAIIADYQDIAEWLQNKGYRHLYVYAFSFGGVVALNAFPDSKPFRRMVLDSVPARPSAMGFRCNVSYDPIDKLPSSCPNITFMHGKTDWVVRRKQTQPLIDAVRACGGALDIQENRGHPFQIEWSSSKAKRVNAMIGHLKLQDAQ